jgi:hypothetical protein
MASRTRSDFYALNASALLETAISAMLALDSPADGVKPVATNRKEALRFLLRSLMFKERTNNVRRVAANEFGVPQS